MGIRTPQTNGDLHSCPEQPIPALLARTEKESTTQINSVKPFLVNKMKKPPGALHQGALEKQIRKNQSLLTLDAFSPFVANCVTKLFLNTEKLIVFGYTIRTTKRAGFNLACRCSNREI